MTRKRRRTTPSPTQRTLQALRKRDSHAQVVERWIANESLPGGGIRIDLFGWIDIVAVQAGHNGVLGIQACSGGDVSTRLAKLTTPPPSDSKRKSWERMRAALTVWLACGNRLEIWGWRKVGPRGKRKTWEVRVVEITPQTLIHMSEDHGTEHPQA